MEEHIVTIATDLSEVALDATLSEGIVKDIPVLGTIINIAKATSSFRERLMLQKVKAFLKPCTTISPDERNRFRDKMNSDPRFKDKVSQVIALYLDKYDAFKKAEILGAIFLGLLRETINLEMFHRLAFCVDRSFVSDLSLLDRYPPVGKTGYKNVNRDPIELSHLVKETNWIEYHITKEGHALLKLMKDAKID